MIDYRGSFKGSTSDGGAFAGKRNKEDRSYVRPLGLTDDARRRLAEKKAGARATA